MGAQWPPITPPALCHAHMAVESHTPRGGAMAVESHVCHALFLTDLHKRGSSDGLTDPEKKLRRIPLVTASEAGRAQI